MIHNIASIIASLPTKPSRVSVISIAISAAMSTLSPGLVNADSDTQKAIVQNSKALTPVPPWPASDQRGMANTIGAGTWARCAYHLGAADAKSYEVSHIRSNTMPLSPFGKPLAYKFTPSVSIPGTRHVFNGELVTGGEPGAQGTQMDALGHFAYYDKAWDGKGDPPVDSAKYYGKYTQKDVKPTPDSPLLKLGIEQAPPIITSAILLDAKAYKGSGKTLEPGTLVTRADIDAMLQAQGLDWRGILPGDAVYIYTGWGDNWQDPDTSKSYYTKGPGLAEDAAEYLKEKAVVVIALDNPFTDPVADGQLQQKAMPPQGMDKGLPFVIHHKNLAESGIHQIQNANLSALANDKVWTSCTIILPLRSQGHAGSPVRPVAIGAPNQSVQ
ncbi:MAG: cyclase family protein [Burkholderiaceae bacterium]